MSPCLICGGLVAAGVSLPGKAFADYQDYRRKYAPWPFWTWRGLRIQRGQLLCIPESGETVKFTGRRMHVRDRWGREESYVIRQIGIGNGRG